MPVFLKGEMEQPQKDCKAGLFLFPVLIPKAKKLASQTRAKMKPVQIERVVGAV